MDDCDIARVRAAEIPLRLAEATRSGSRRTAGTAFARRYQFVERRLLERIGHEAVGATEIGTEGAQVGTVDIPVPVKVPIAEVRE